MEFFLHSTLNEYSRKLNLIKKHYGIAGLGFYWRAVEKLMWEGQKVSIETLVALRDKPIRYADAKEIIKRCGLFIVDDTNYVIMANDIENGIAKNTMDNYFANIHIDNPEKLTAEVCWDTCTDACTDAYTDARTDVCADARTDACTDACADARTDACYLDNKDLDKEKDIDKEEHKLLKEFMEKNYPHLLQMQEPLNMEQFKALRNNYSRDQIEEVFLQMENSIDLYKKKRSCYLTALSWLKARSNKVS